MASKADGDAVGRRSPGRPKLEDVASIDRKLLEVALREFVEHGYGAASLTRIVKDAEVSKTTLYSRFSSKAELFRAIIQLHVDRIGANTALRSSDGRRELAEGLTAYANRMLERSLQGGFLDINRLVYGESHRFPELGQFAQERTDVGIQQIADFIQECGERDGKPCRNPRAVGETFIMLLRGWYLNAMITGRNVSVSEREQWVDHAVAIFCRGRDEW